jgi:hypothetical protein
MWGKISFSILAVVFSIHGTAIANAAKVRPGASSSREALLLSCRKQVFNKYGQRGRFGKRWLQKTWLVQQTDACVANGGKAI